MRCARTAALRVRATFYHIFVQARSGTRLDQQCFIISTCERRIEANFGLAFYWLRNQKSRELMEANSATR